ncbi:MAG: DUF4258 domain-containing protein [Ignavibacteriae bacterium]|nr:DUF4258 domain-containing protein [Ignavibacteriota bacterium]
MKRIRFGKHAEAKFDILREHGVILNKRIVKSALLSPERVDEGYAGRRVAQAILDDEHVLRVVFEESDVELKIITFYPGRRERYED